MPPARAAETSAETSTSTETWEGFEGGDLIFIETSDPVGPVLERATGSRFTHVGIVRRTGGGFAVIEAAPDGVYEIMLEPFLERAIGGNYAVYRYPGLWNGDWYHPAVLEANAYLGYPPDPHFRLDPSAFYGSELVYDSYKAAGVALGKLERIGDLDFDTQEGRALLLSGWAERPDCKARHLDEAACWSLIMDQKIVTPASIARDPRLDMVFSTFPPPE